MSAGKLPEGWTQALLGDYLYLKNGLAFKSTEYVPPMNSSFPVIRISDLNGTCASDRSAVHVLQEVDGFNIEKGDLLIAMSGATTGKIGVYIGSTPAYQNQRVGNIKLRSHKYGNEQYRNYLISSISKKILDEAYGGAQPNISGKTIEAFSFYLAPLSEQKIIAEKLDTLLAQVDSAKARLNKIPQTLKRFRQAVLATAVGGILTYEWRINQNITEGQPHPLSKAGTIIAGQSPASSQVNNLGKGVPYVTGPEQWDGSKILHHKWTEYPKKISPDNSIFVTVKGAGVGTTFPGCHCAIGRDVYAFVPNQEMNYKYTLYAIQAAAADVVVKAKGLIPGLTKADILEHYVYIPVIEEQHEIVRRVEQLFAYADTIEKQVNSALTRVNSLTQSILAKAFRGELTAQWRAENPNLISGENSAAALLEKIKAERTASGSKKTTRKKA
ncbi:restriction endonuclease subunit S [Klebsiella michiganensis]|uniref:restriction endonuclease subunit S n=1 Tax=Klebsiella michiganensis TaxID=1134687 RepID=UPI001C7EEA46|nr:restriction endonuclease subunit S [Klebsiella michiganensis]